MCYKNDTLNLGVNYTTCDLYYCGPRTGPRSGLWPITEKFGHCGPHCKDWPGGKQWAVWEAYKTHSCTVWQKCRAFWCKSFGRRRNFCAGSKPHWLRGTAKLQERSTLSWPPLSHPPRCPCQFSTLSLELNPESVEGGLRLGIGKVWNLCLERSDIQTLALHVPYN
jgi:hypothetical protein